MSKSTVWLFLNTLNLHGFTGIIPVNTDYQFLMLKSDVIICLLTFYLSKCQVKHDVACSYRKLINNNHHADNHWVITILILCFRMITDF